VNPEHQVIASGYNGAPRTMKHCDEVGCEMEDGSNHCIRAIHAEENAILQCAVNGVSPKGCTLYVTHSPCYRCALRFIQVEIVQVRFGMVYGKDYKKVANLLRDHEISIFGYINFRGYFIIGGEGTINNE
jgi:dCMP deaminase